MTKNAEINRLRAHLSQAIQVLCRVQEQADKTPGCLGGYREEAAFVTRLAFDTFGWTTMVGWLDRSERTGF